MKIAFLSGGLEPGKDGVGDYTRLLAAECVRQSQTAGILALRDRWVDTPVCGNGALGEGAARNGSAEGAALAEWRLPLSLTRETRAQLAAEFVQRHDPEWVSLQFVPYAFHPKGITHGLARRLRPLTQGRRLHVMFHELWIGAERGAPAKERLVGKLQRAYVLELLRVLGPERIHTSNDAYTGRLGQCGIRADSLPLFGNIPIASGRADAWLFPRMQQAGIPIDSANRPAYWLCGLFGGLHTVWPPEPLLTLLQNAARQANRKLVLLAIGNLGPGEALWERLAARYDSVPFVKLGLQPAENISRYLNTLDVGIATSPYSLIGKSSSVAAMREHGLPVIVNRDDVHYPNLAPPPGEEALLYKADAHLAARLASGLARGPIQSRLPDVARRFLQTLQNVGPVGQASG